MRRSISGVESSYTLVDLKSKNLPLVSARDGYGADNPSQPAPGGGSDRVKTRLSQRLANKEVRLQDCKTGAHAIALTERPTEAAQYVCRELDLAGNELRCIVREVIDGEVKKSARSEIAIAEAMVAAWRKYSTLRKGMKFTKGVKAFFGEAGFWKDECRWADTEDAQVIPMRRASTEMQRQLRES